MFVCLLVLSVSVTSVYLSHVASSMGIIPFLVACQFRLINMYVCASIYTFWSLTIKQNRLIAFDLSIKTVTLVTVRHAIKKFPRRRSNHGCHAV